ncbi:MAG: NupC/NupG family nucleoside CNT transporter, partial [Bacteroidia bacterium]
DSTAYVVRNGEPTVIYFSDGKILAEVKGSGLSPNKLTKPYQIVELTDEKLVLVENGVTNTFTYKKTEALITNFSWGGFLNGLIGIFGLTAITFALSSHKRRVNWPLAGKALLLQFVFAFFVLRVPAFREVFSAVASVFVTILGFTREGSTFLFGGLVNNVTSFGFIFVFQVLPTIIFFAALTSALFYLNILQWIVYGFAWVMNKAMKLSGAESLSSAANIFLGQTEAPLMVKPYISGMTRSETLALMTGGMASISGGVMAAYIGFLGGPDPEQQRIFATHLLSASIMTAPATFFAAKILIPETEEFNRDMKISKERVGSNLLDAIANGTTEGLKLAVNVAAMLLVFIALMAMLNFIMLNGVGAWTGLNEKIVAASNGRYEGLTLQYVLGYVFAPIAWLIGIRGTDVSLVGQLLGQKVIINEFVAYVSFADLKANSSFVFDKSVIITTYALCGFANFSSIGIQLGGIGTLAPTKRPMLAELGIRALIGGTIANLMSGTIAGMMI